MKLYQYTLLKQNGDREVLAPCKKKEFGGTDGLYELLHCRTIELIPKDYWPDWLNKRGTVYGDEEGRYTEGNITNPHMKKLYGNPALGEPPVWDCVGDLIFEEVFHETVKE